MKSFKEFVELKEELITFNNKAYPKFGNIVILAGGAGSGKGFILKNLVGLEGKVLDVDEIKNMARESDLITSRIKKDKGIDISKMDLRNPSNVSKLHVLLKSTVGKFSSKFFQSVMSADPKRLPNIVFDVTLKDIHKFDELIHRAELLGYNKLNIHLVWIVNDVEVAAEQNKDRTRVVPEDILFQTHTGAAQTFKQIIKKGDQIAKYINGDIWLAFNNKKAGDSKLKTKSGQSKYSKNFVGYVQKTNKYKLKSAGERRVSAIPDQFVKKIFDYTGEKF